MIDLLNIDTHYDKMPLDIPAGINNNNCNEKFAIYSGLETYAPRRSLQRETITIMKMNVLINTVTVYCDPLTLIAGVRKLPHRVLLELGIDYVCCVQLKNLKKKVDLDTDSYLCDSFPPFCLKWSMLLVYYEC